MHIHRPWNPNAFPSFHSLLSLSLSLSDNSFGDQKLCLLLADPNPNHPKFHNAACGFTSTIGYATDHLSIGFVHNNPLEQDQRLNLPSPLSPILEHILSPNARFFIAAGGIALFAMDFVTWKRSERFKGKRASVAVSKTPSIDFILFAWVATTIDRDVPYSAPCTYPICFCIFFNRL